MDVLTAYTGQRSVGMLADGVVLLGPVDATMKNEEGKKERLGDGRWVCIADGEKLFDRGICCC